jgi:hypothetical protein
LASFCLGQNHLYVKIFFIGSPLFRSISEILYWLQVRRIGSLSVVRTTVPSRPDASRPSIICPDDVVFHPDLPLYREASMPSCICPDDSAARPDDVQRSISFRFSFKVQIREDWCNRPDDVDSRLDALIHKARIAIQIQPSGCQSAWSGRAFNRYGNCVFNFNRPDACSSDMEIACWRLTIWTAIPLGPDTWSLIWKLLAEDVQPSGWRCLTFRTRFSNRKDF